jgi:hypothetical protein
MGDKPYLSVEVDEHASDVGLITRVEAFIGSVRAHRRLAGKTGKTEAASKDAPARLAPLVVADSLNKATPVLIPWLRPYSQLACEYLRARGYSAIELAPTSAQSLALGRALTRGKEYFTLTALLGDALMASEAHPGAQLLVPINGGAEADGEYALMAASALEGRLSIVSLNIERLFWRDEDGADTLFRLLLAGDKELAQGASVAQTGADGSTAEQRPSVLLVGEPSCLHNALFRSAVADRINAAGVNPCFAPLSELALFEWAQSAQRGSESRAGRNGDVDIRLRRLENALYQAALELGNTSSFASSVKELQSTTGMGECKGAWGLYRHARSSTAPSSFSGVICAASLHENTAAILEALRPSVPTAAAKTPLCDLRFDGTLDAANQLKLDAFLDALGQQASQAGSP